MSTLTSLPTRSKIIIGAVALGVVLLVFFMVRLALAPSYTTMLTGLDPAQAGEVTAALDEQGIGYELQANGTALAVAKSDKAKARVALAGQGLASGGPGGEGAAPGFELFDAQKLGASDFQQKVTYQRALEGEVAKTINGVQGVQNAQVQLVLPEEDLFADEATSATAAVSLGNPGDALEPGAVKGIAQLVSSSVKGLKPANVNITDATGQVLWPSGDGGGTGGSSKQAAETRYARSLESKLNAMLTRTLGPNKGTVQVQADLNMDKTVRNELRYGRRGTPEMTETETEQLEGQGGGAAGVAGAAGNIPTYGAAGGAGGDSNYERETEKTKTALDKTVSKTDVAQGAVERLNVALVLDSTVAPVGARGNAARAPIEAMIATAAGVDQARGDTVTATSLAFAKPPAEKAPGGLPVPPGIIGPLKWVGLGFAVLLFLFFMMRHLKKREADALPEPAWLAAIDQPVSLAALESSTGQTQVMEPLPERETDPGLQRLEMLMEREPERVAAQVRQWMTEE